MRINVKSVSKSGNFYINSISSTYFGCLKNMFIQCKIRLENVVVIIIVSSISFFLLRSKASMQFSLHVVNIYFHRP